MKALRTIAVSGFLLVGVLGCSNYMPAVSAISKAEKTILCPKETVLTIKNVNGSLKITEGRDGKIHLSAEKVAWAGNKADAEALLKKVHIKIKNEGNRIIVETEFPKLRKSFFPFSTKSITVAVNYIIKVPKGTGIDAQTVNGNMSVGIPSSNVKCETTNGAIDIWAARLLSVSSVNGAVSFKVINIKKVETTNGSVKGEIESLKPVEGDICTVNGGIVVTVSPKAAFRLNARNRNGSITSDFQKVNGSKHNFGADINGGGKTVSLETLNGSISVLKKTP